MGTQAVHSSREGGAALRKPGVSLPGVSLPGGWEAVAYLSWSVMSPVSGNWGDRTEAEEV